MRNGIISKSIEQDCFRKALFLVFRAYAAAAPVKKQYSVSGLSGFCPLSSQQLDGLVSVRPVAGWFGLGTPSIIPLSTLMAIALSVRSAALTLHLCKLPFTTLLQAEA